MNPSKKILTMAGMEKSKWASSSSRGSIITRKKMLNRGNKEACMGVIPKKFY